MEVSCQLFDELWNGDPVRHLGISFAQLEEKDVQQLSLFQDPRLEKGKRLDALIDRLRTDFGRDAVIRATFVNSPVKAFSGGVEEKDYVFMNSYL
jgi:DNA polymerase-4